MTVEPPAMSVRSVGWRAPSGALVLRDVSIEIQRGECVGVLGRNGAGKSTLLEIMAGLREPIDGDVYLHDRPLRQWSSAERGRCLAYLSQVVRADLSLRAEALVLMGRYPHAVGWFDSAGDRRVARKAMHRCECAAFADRVVGSLSGGERQRVYLAACLAQEADVLLLDEPATFLDVDQQLQSFAAVRAEAARGTACVVVTHDVNLALTHCTRLVVLHDQRIIADVPVGAALDEPRWLLSLSSRARVERGPGGTWIRYQ